MDNFPNDTVEKYFNQPGSDRVHFLVWLPPENGEFHVIGFVPRLTLLSSDQTPSNQMKAIVKAFLKGYHPQGLYHAPHHSCAIR